MQARLLNEHRRLNRGGRPRRAYREALDRLASDYMPPLKLSTQDRYRTSFLQLAPTFGGLYLDETTRGRLAVCDQPPIRVSARNISV